MVATVEWMVDMSAVDQLIGVGFALGTIGRQSRYMQDLISCAYRSANAEFNRQAAAYAAASGHMGHMFEWGTVGINTSPSNMKLEPTDPRARLWKNVFTPGRKWSNLTFEFRPSVATVPKPPADKTGIDQAVLNRLKDHIFWNKAFVMETGAPVTIRPKADNAKKLLFVPKIWKGEEGYEMYNRPTNPDISSNTEGTFTSLWTEFFGGGPAEKQMSAEIKKWFRQDMNLAYKRIKGRQKLHRPADYDNETITYTAEVVRKDFEKAAAMRLARSKVDEYAD